MNKDEAMQQALEQPKQQAEPVACRFCFSKKGCWTWQCYHCGEIDDVQQPALPLPVQEPIGYVKGTYAGRLIYDTINPAVCLPVGMALYTAPLPLQESLTEEEIEAIGDQVANEKLVGRVPDFRVRFARAIEAKLKDKNHD